ncbi:MAG: PKD domain-containing protein [Bacteroidales bacterium]|nr:PKD domain-containing protein [Bacteroidales bacterium]HOI31219.1 PKD domain-containing protein [Bacteroidales bacterium]
MNLLSFITKKQVKISFVTALLIIGSFVNIIKAQEVITIKAESLTIDFIEIDGLAARMEFYDFVRTQPQFTNVPLETGKIQLKANADELRKLEAELKEAFDLIIQNNEHRDKTEATEIMLNLQEKHGTDLLDRVMGRDAVNDSCHKSFPFCTTNIYTFPAGVNSGTGQAGPNYGCLGSTPNPAWYHMKILTPGNINIFMQSSPLRDIDFIVWGPFTDPVMPCQGALTGNKIVSCSYSANPTETANIPNGQTGEYYILLITNYSNNPCEITFSKTGGSGETDCTILPPPIGSNSPVCYGDDLFLTAESYPDAIYSWTGPNGFTSNQQNPVINNPGFEYAGTYTLEITVDGITSEPISLDVEIAALSDPAFDFTEVCYGNPSIFTDQSTVNPPDYPITSWQWNFDDGNTSTQQNPQHSFANPGTYDVTLTTYTGEEYCSRSITQSIEIPEYPYVDAGEDQEIPNGWSANLTGEASGGTGDLSYLWEPQNLVNDPTSLSTSTVNLGQTSVFTLTITDNISGCVSSDDVIVSVTGGALFVQAMADPDVICVGESTQLDAMPSGGAGDYTFSWISNPAGFTSNIRNPVISPIASTSYTVSVFDGQLTVTSTVEVTVKPVPVANAGQDLTANVGTSVILNGSASGGSGTYNYLWSPADSLANPATDPFLASPTTKLLNVPTTYQLIINDNNGCVSPSDAVTVFTGGDYLAVFAQTEHEVICLLEETQLSATALGGSGAYTYSWTANNSSWTSNEQNPIVSPESSTIYTVEANDGFKIVSSSTMVNVNSLPQLDIRPADIPLYSPDTINVCVRDSVWLDAGPNLNYIWSNGSNARKVKVTTNGNWIDIQTWWVEVTNPVTGCKSDDTLTIFFDFNTCNIGLDERNNRSTALNISPNPAGEFVRLMAPEITTDAQLFIFADNGKLLFEKALPADHINGISETIKLNNFKAGSYQVLIITDEAYAAKSLIIY